MSKACLRSVVVIAMLLLSSCGDDSNEGTSSHLGRTVLPEVRAWARVAGEQVAEARKYGAPVAFENDIETRPRSVADRADVLVRVPV